MNYVPKVGDRVILNPEAMALASKPPATCFEVWKEGTVAIVLRVENHERDKSCFVVSLDMLCPLDWHCHSVAINKVSGAYWQAAATKIPLFLPVGRIVVVQNLKKLNSKPDSIICHQCGELLKSPYPNIKFCPKCEP